MLGVTSGGLLIVERVVVQQTQCTDFPVCTLADVRCGGRGCGQAGDCRDI